MKLSNSTFPLIPTLGLIATLCLGTSAHADMIGDCYANAEAANAGLKISVSVGDTAVVKSSKLAPVMAAIAEHYEASSLTLDSNKAGRKALRSAMHCMFSNGKATLSAIVLNQNFDKLRVRPVTVRSIAKSNGSQAAMDFTGVSSTLAAEHALRFEGHGSSTDLPVKVRGHHDFQGGLNGVTNICSAGPLDPCSGTCLGESTPEGMATCYCDGGTGSCSSGITDFKAGGSNEIAIVLQ